MVLNKLPNLYEKGTSKKLKIKKLKNCLVDMDTEYGQQKLG